jgi:acetyl esterase/lipase
MMPVVELTDISAARAQMIETYAALFGEPDESGVQVRDEVVPGPDGDPDVRVRIYTPDRKVAPAAVYDVHGGGFILGTIDISHAQNLRLARELGS